MKKKSHLLKLLKMDLHRCIGAKRFPVIIALIVVLLIANVWDIGNDRIAIQNAYDGKLRETDGTADI